MRTTGYLGTAFVLAGCLLILASTGAFDATVAERGMAVDTATDQNAFLGLEYANPNRTVALEGGCSFFFCLYSDVELLVLRDNTAAGNLSVSNFTSQQSSSQIVAFGIDNVSHPTGIEAVEGSFFCPSSGFPPDQESASMTITLYITATDGNTTIDLTRNVFVECVG